MPYNESTADRVRALILDMNVGELTEKKMFGGVTFLYKGKMTVGIVKDELAVRVLGKDIDHWLEQPYVRPMDFTKKPMKEFVFVEPDGFRSDAQLRTFIELGLAHAKTKV